MMLSQSITSTLCVWENAFIKKNLKTSFFMYSTLCVSRGHFRENYEYKSIWSKSCRSSAFAWSTVQYVSLLVVDVLSTDYFKPLSDLLSASVWASIHFFPHFTFQLNCR